MLLAQEPKIGLSEIAVKQALETDPGSDYFFGLFNAGSENSTGKYFLATAALGITITGVMLLLK